MAPSFDRLGGAHRPLPSNTLMPCEVPPLHTTRSSFAVAVQIAGYDREGVPVLRLGSDAPSSIRPLTVADEHVVQLPCYMSKTM
jgi:hypothetical protein